jgi:hypothetical protein
MGIDYDFRLAVGFRVTSQEIEETFGEPREEDFHMEQRFDPRTGKRLEDEKVVTRPAGLNLVLRDCEFDSVEELVDAMAGEVGAVSYPCGSYMGGDEFDFIIGPKVPDEATSGFEDSHITVDGGFPFERLAELGPELARIKKELDLKFSFEVRNPEVAIAWTVS